MNTDLNALSQDECEIILRHRALMETGYPVHKAEDGDYYIWSMGTQNSTLVSGTIAGAVDLFLKHYLPRETPSMVDYVQPVPRPKMVKVRITKSIVVEVESGHGVDPQVVARNRCKGGWYDAMWAHVGGITEIIKDD